jgi:DNA-binding XRE family transcriptional regulator
MISYIGSSESALTAISLSQKMTLHGTKPMKNANAPGFESTTERAIFGRNFREARTSARLSQRDIHRMTGIAQSHVSQIENGDINICIDTMVKLSSLVGKPLWQLFKP